MNKMDCHDCQHLNPQFMWCEKHRKEIEKPWEEACKDFVPRLWKLDPYDEAWRLEKTLDIANLREEF